MIDEIKQALEIAQVKSCATGGAKQPITFQWVEYLVGEVEEMQTELEESHDESDRLNQIIFGQSHFIDALHKENERLRKALEEITKVAKPTPVLTYQAMEDIARQALKERSRPIM